MSLKNFLHIFPKLTVGFWQITETKEALQALLSQDKYTTYPDFKNPKRVKEWLATRCMTQKMMPGSQIGYKKNGKPYFINQNATISISHSANFVAVLINENATNVGIDIELVGSRAKRIAKRFMNTNELQKFTSNYETTLVWCCKEALYKLYGKPVADFRNDISITRLNNNTVDAIYLNEHHSLGFHLHNDLLIVWALLK